MPLSDPELMIMDQDFELKENMSTIKAYAENLIRCDYCQATFSKRYNLVRHMKKRLMDRMYPCEDCGQLFVAENIL